MSFKPDVAKAEQARQEGNSAFKKGRWAEAIGAYTTAVLNNPDDAVPYTNRAAAYLKLEKYKDAERDCTMALERSPGHIKALYRRAVALKGQERYADSLKEAVVAIERSNEMALNELEEVKALLAKQKRTEEAKKEKKGLLPGSPPRQPSKKVDPPAPETFEPVSSKRIHKQEEADTKGSEKVEIGEVKASSFADLRKSRGERKTYISTSTNNGTTGQNTKAGETAPQAQSLEKRVEQPNTATFSSSSPTKDIGKTQRHTHSPPVPQVESQPKSPVQASSSTRDESSVKQPPTLQRPITPPLYPESTSSASGFQLLTRLSRLDIPSGWTYLSYYPASIVPTILAPLLEPETLGQLLVVLRRGVEEDKERVKVILEGLKKTSRWVINSAMLEKHEEQAGKEAWSISGAEGSW